MTFGQFMAMVDDEIMHLTGMMFGIWDYSTADCLDHTDLCDYDYHSAWKDEREPVEVARAVLENDDMFWAGR